MNRKHLQKQHASWIEGLQTSITRVIVTTWYYQMNTYPWWTNHRLMKFQGGKDLTILRWYKWYNVAMIKLDWGWIFLDPFPVEISAIWAAETQEISSRKERKGKERKLAGTERSKRRKTLCPWGKQVQAHGGSAPPIQCPCISCNALNLFVDQKSGSGPRRSVLGSAHQHSKGC